MLLRVWALPAVDRGWQHSKCDDGWNAGNVKCDIRFGKTTRGQVSNTLASKGERSRGVKETGGGEKLPWREVTWARDR
jgi:hypothetical protein